MNPLQWGVGAFFTTVAVSIVLKMRYELEREKIKTETFKTKSQNDLEFAAEEAAAKREETEIKLAQLKRLEEISQKEHALKMQELAKKKPQASN